MDMAPSRQDHQIHQLSCETKRWRNGINLETADNDEMKALSNGESRYTDERSGEEGLMGSLEMTSKALTKETFQGEEKTRRGS